ncbi:MAG: hypothetical protein LRY55_13215 [Leadbetterella sp.]|nr:hypothetical protein [Leadbetterella sp.]
MKKALTSLLITLISASCNSPQNTDTHIDGLAVLADSAAVAEDGTAGDQEFAPYGKARAEELSAARKNELEAILKARGVAPKEIPALAAALRKTIGFNEWDVVEEGENIQASGTNREPVTLTSLIFGPFDGNGRGYSVLAIAGNRIYLSEEHWKNDGIDSAYNIQMASDKKIAISDSTVSITRRQKGK